MLIKRLTATCLAAAILALVIIPPSFAAGSFTYRVKFKCCKDSRSWTQGSGSTTISCDHKVPTYRIELYRNQTFDKSYGRATYRCGEQLRYTRKKLPSGTYHFHISKADDGVTVSGSGSVRYP